MLLACFHVFWGEMQPKVSQQGSVGLLSGPRRELLWPVQQKAGGAGLCAGSGDVRAEGDGCLPVAALSLFPDFCVAASVFVSFLSVLGARSHLTVFG